MSKSVRDSVRRRRRVARTSAWLVSAAVGLFALLACQAPEPTPTAVPTPIPTVAPVVPAVAATPRSVPDPVPVPGMEPVAPFTNIARDAFGKNAFVNNWHPGSVFFDFDRDGDNDIYITQANGDSELPEAPGGPNLLFRNDGDGVFTEVGAELNADATLSNSTAAAACDFDNDGYQDLYLAGYGLIGDELDYRSAAGDARLTNAIKDRLLRNVGGTRFEDVTDAAFGDAVNLRSAITIACADVDNDGDLDVFVGNTL